METLVNIVAQGLALGSILLLSALGLTIIYGVMGVINLAHGEFIMLGSYAMVAIAAALGAPAAIAAAFILVGVAGYFADLTLIRFLYQKPVASMLGTWGLAMVLRQTVTLAFGPDLRYVVLPLTGSFSIGFGATFSVWRAVLIASALATAAGVGLVIARTSFGLKMRAVIENPSAAEALGLRVDRVNRLSFAFGCALAGLAGALVAPLRSVSPGVGTGYLVGAFLVVILAGLGNVRATVFWAALIGLVSSAVSLAVNELVAQIAVWAAALVIISIRREAVTAIRV